jgi:trimeric autotransporter adhesin
MKTTFTKTTLILHLALAAAFLFAGLTRAIAQTTETSTSTSNTPALIMSFDGQATNNVAQLTWVMENETNSKYFVIERSGDTGGYDSIGVVIGLNNNNMTTYTFTDNEMTNGNNYYRLRMVDMDGVVRYSKIVSLYDQQQTTTVSTRMSIYPNPAIATINYTISATSNEQVFVQVYNLSGVVLLTTEQQLNAGNNVQTLAVSSLKAGNYFLKITSADGSSQFVQPFVKLM